MNKRDEFIDDYKNHRFITIMNKYDALCANYAKLREVLDLVCMYAQDDEHSDSDIERIARAALEADYKLYGLELRIDQKLEIGAECLTCKKTNHTGIWNGKNFQVCPICGDRGILDNKAIEILISYKAEEG